MHRYVHGRVWLCPKDLCGVKRDNAEHLRKAVADGRVVRVTKRDVLGEGFAIPASFDAATSWPQCAEVINDIRDQVCSWPVIPTGLRGVEHGSHAK